MLRHNIRKSGVVKQKINVELSTFNFLKQRDCLRHT